MQIKEGAGRQVSRITLRTIGGGQVVGWSWADFSRQKSTVLVTSSLDPTVLASMGTWLHYLWSLLFPVRSLSLPCVSIKLCSDWEEEHVQFVFDTFVACSLFDLLSWFFPFNWHIGNFFTNHEFLIRQHWLRPTLVVVWTIFSISAVVFYPPWWLRRSSMTSFSWSLPAAHRLSPAL